MQAQLRLCLYFRCEVNTMIKRFNKNALAWFTLALLVSCFTALSIPVRAQKAADPKYQLSGNGMIKVSPADLGVNALTEPGSGTTASSSIIDLTGARAFTLKFSCTQGAITVNTTTYAEDGTTALTTGAPVSAVAAATNTDLYVGTEQDLTATTGTLSTTFKLRLPQKAISFTFTNASASAGTCTARLFLVY
jgi:hypothetical protein